MATSDIDDRLVAAHRLLMEKNISITFGVSAYNEGEGIVATLASLWAGMQKLGLYSSPIILSDSSSTYLTVQTAQEWADTSGANLIINYSDKRRSLKAALNVILEECHTDLLIVSVGDVVIPELSLLSLIEALLSSSAPDVAIGISWPDPSVSGWRYRAGCWQLRAVARLAVLSSAEEIRAEGAFWGARRQFFEGFRYKERSGSISDDVQLQRAVRIGGYKGANVSSALAYKIPPGTIRDFCLQTRRSYFAVSDQPYKRTKLDYLALYQEASNDPLGALLYISYRFYAFLYMQKFESGTNTETWEISITTKRLGVINEKENTKYFPFQIALPLGQKIVRFVSSLLKRSP